MECTGSMRDMFCALVVVIPSIYDCSEFGICISAKYDQPSYISLVLYLLKRRCRTGIAIPIINTRRSDDRLMFIIGIPIRRSLHCSGSLEPESSCHDRDWIMELPMEADILTFTGIFTPEDASVASCFPFDITISLSWFPLLSIPPLHSAIP